MDRSPTYGPEIAEEICRRLAEGETLRSICRDEGMPHASTVVFWVNKDPDFAKRYAHARSQGLDVMAESIVDIADDLTEDPNSRRVRVDSRKWLLSKMRPDKYGDRVSLDGKLGLEVNDLTKIRANVTAVIAATNLPPEVQYEIGRRMLEAASDPADDQPPR